MVGTEGGTSSKRFGRELKGARSTGSYVISNV